VKYAETWILAKLRDRKFFSFEEARIAVRETLEELNDREIKSRKGWTRRKAFQEEEAPFLKPLPKEPYEPAVWLPEQKVGHDYLVSDGINKYSVPFDLIGQKVTVKTTRKLVEIYFHGERMAVHVRKMISQRDPIVKLEHMPAEHQAYMMYTEEDFTAWGKDIGPATQLTVESFLHRWKEPEQGYKFCAGLQKLAKKYSGTRLEAACEKLLECTSNPDIRTLSSMLHNGQDKIKKPKEAKEQKRSSTGHTRGADYYRTLKGGASK